MVGLGKIIKSRMVCWCIFKMFNNFEFLKVIFFFKLEVFIKIYIDRIIYGLFFWVYIIRSAFFYKFCSWVEKEDLIKAICLLMYGRIRFDCYKNMKVCNYFVWFEEF